jgi:hypothetical protein
MLQEQTIIGSPLAGSYVCFITQKAEIHHDKGDVGVIRDRFEPVASPGMARYAADERNRSRGRTPRLPTRRSNRRQVIVTIGAIRPLAVIG